MVRPALIIFAFADSNFFNKRRKDAEKYLLKCFFLLAIEISMLTSKDCCGLGFFMRN